MTRFVIDARTLLHIVRNGIQLNPAHQLVAPNTIRSHALCLLFEEVKNGDLTEELTHWLKRPRTSFRSQISAHSPQADVRRVRTPDASQIGTLAHAPRPAPRDDDHCRQQH